MQEYTTSYTILKMINDSDEVPAIAGDVEDVRYSQTTHSDWPPSQINN